VLAEAVRRLADYQDQAYADTYLARVRALAARPGADGIFVRELARHLALRMSVEDVIRVAELKLRRGRLQRLRVEARAGAGDIVDVSEYMRPGAGELLSLLPPRLGRWAAARVRADRALAMRVRSTRLFGFLRLRMLAALRPWRQRTLRFADENAWIERWLDLVARTLAVCPRAAAEVVAAAGLVRGYSDTYQRGLASFAHIATQVVEPMLAGRLPRAHFADAVLQARMAAAKDPTGAALSATLESIGGLARAAANERPDGGRRPEAGPEAAGA